MQSKFPLRPATLEHHVPSADNDPHAATEVWSLLHGMTAAGTQKPLTPNRQKASQVLELRPPSLFQNSQQTVGSVPSLVSHTPT